MAEIECRRSRKGIFPVFGFALREGRKKGGGRSFSLSESNPRSVYKQQRGLPAPSSSPVRRPGCPRPAVAFPLMGMAVGKERTSRLTDKLHHKEIA